MKNYLTVNGNDRVFILSVAEDYGIDNLTDSDVQRAHEFASNAAEEDYYYRLKEFFNN